MKRDIHESVWWSIAVRQITNVQFKYLVLSTFNTNVDKFTSTVRYSISIGIPLNLITFQPCARVYSTLHEFTCIDKIRKYFKMIRDWCICYSIQYTIILCKQNRYHIKWDIIYSNVKLHYWRDSLYFEWPITYA